MHRNNAYHPWVSVIIDNATAIAIMQDTMLFTSIRFLAERFMPVSLIRKREDHTKFCKVKVVARLVKQTDRLDIWSLVIKAQAESVKEGEGGISMQDMYDNAKVFMIAGTETTATLLSGLSYLLLSKENEHVLIRLKGEIRSFQAEDVLNMTSLQKCEYLNACIDEALRVYPPVQLVVRGRLHPKAQLSQETSFPGMQVSPALQLPHSED